MENKVSLLIFSPYYPPHIGGLELHAHDFNTHAVLRDHRITVWTSRLPKTSLPYEIVDSVNIYRYEAVELLGGFPVPVFWLPDFWKQYTMIFKQDHDYILSRTRFFASSLLGLCIGKIKKIPLIHIEHGSDYVQLTNPMVRAIAYIYDNTIGRFVLQSAHRVVANSYASAAFVTSLTKNKVHPKIIYRGINELEVERAKSIQKNPGIVTICYTGRLISGKGVQDLIKAISQLRLRNIRCWIIGDGPMRKQLEQLSDEHNLSHVITFLGKMDNAKTFSYIKSCDIFVNPSYTEGIPTSVIEAALCKRAIIATRVGGTMEIIVDKKSGILIEPHNSVLLKDALEFLLENSAIRDELGRNAYAENIGKFSWEHAMNEYEALFC